MGFSHTDMVSVVCYLVVELSWLGIHPGQPVQAPADFIHYIRDPVASGGAVCLM